MAVRSTQYSWDTHPAVRMIETCLEWAGIEVVYSGGRCNRSADVCFAKTKSMDSEIKDFIEESSNTKYDTALPGRLSDSEIGLVRENGLVDRLLIYSNSFSICTDSETNNASSDGISCKRFFTSEDTISKLKDFDKRATPRGRIAIHRTDEQPTIDDNETFTLFQTLSPGMKSAVHAIDSTERASQGWSLSSLGLVGVGPKRRHDDFFKDAARSHTVQLITAGEAIIDMWTGLQGGQDGNWPTSPIPTEQCLDDKAWLDRGISSHSGLKSAADDIVEMTAQVYLNPNEMKELISSNSKFGYKLLALLTYGYITESQYHHVLESADAL